MYYYAPTIEGYIFDADLFCPTCLVEELIARRIAAPAARDMDTEEVLDQIAGASAIERDGDFDTNEFPAPIWSSSTHGNCTRESGCIDRCWHCNESLGGVDCYPLDEDAE